MDPQKIIRHISFYDRKPASKPKMFAGDQMTSRQFGGWKQVTTGPFAFVRWRRCVMAPVFSSEIFVKVYLSLQRTVSDVQNGRERTTTYV